MSSNPAPERLQRMATMSPRQTRSVPRLVPVFCRERADKTQNVPNWDRFTIVGTSTEIFKDYLRLTSVSVHELEFASVVVRCLCVYGDLTVPMGQL